MSRGYGRWEQELIRAAGDVHTVPVAAVVRRCVPEPSRSNFVAARRAAKTLALEGTLIAVYVNACQQCLHVQDHEPTGCCGTVRSALAVTMPGHLLPHLAPPPAGERCPPWITVSAAVCPVDPPGELATPGAADVSRLMLRECHARLASAPRAVSLREAAAVVRAAWLIERDTAIAREVTRAVADVNDAWMDAMDRLQRQVRRQQGERDAAVAARDRAGAERDAARRRVKQLEERIMRDLFRTADEAGMSGLPVLSGTPHVTAERRARGGSTRRGCASPADRRRAGRRQRRTRG